MPLRLPAVWFALLLAGCSGGATSIAVSPEELQSEIEAAQTPVVVLFWAGWSRPAVEMLPAAAELAAEYEGAGVAFWTVSLGGPAGDEAKRVLGRFPAGTRHWTLEGDPMMALSRLGLTDAPAALLYGPAGELRFALDSSDATALTPADLADGIDEMLAAGP